MNAFVAVTDDEAGMVQGAPVQYVSHCTGQAGRKAQGNKSDWAKVKNMSLGAGTIRGSLLSVRIKGRCILAPARH